jgi:hypothetical protein
MSRSLNQIAESILKLSNIFYSLSDTTYKTAASPTLEEARQIRKDLSKEKLSSIEEYNELLPSSFESIRGTIRLAILSLNANEKYLSELAGSLDGQECVVKLDCLIKICDEIIRNKVGVFDYVQYVNDINKLIEDEDQKLQKFDFIKYIISPLIDKIKFVSGLDITNYRSKKQFEEIIVAGGRYKKDEKFSEELLEKEESVEDIDDLLINYPKEELSEIDKKILELQLNPINEITQEFENLQKNINEGGGQGRATELKSLRQKTNIQLEVARARLESAKERLKKLKEESPQNKENIEEEESIIELYNSSIEALKGKSKWGAALDQLDRDLRAGETEETKAEALQKFNNAFKVHKSALKEARQIYYTSLRKAESLGKLSDENYSWVKDIALDDYLIQKLRDCQDFFIKCRTNPYLYGGVKASQFKNQFPFFVSKIKSKQIEKDDLENQILELFNLREEALKYSEAYSEIKSLKGQAAHLAENTLRRLERLLVKKRNGTLTEPEVKELENITLENFQADLLPENTNKKIEELILAKSDQGILEKVVTEFIEKSTNDFLLFKEKIRHFCDRIDATLSQSGEVAIRQFKDFKPDQIKKLINALKEEDPRFLNAVKSEIFIIMYLTCPESKMAKLTRTKLLQAEDPLNQIKEFIKNNNFDEFEPQIDRRATGTISSLAKRVDKLKPERQFGPAVAALETFQKNEQIAKVIRNIRDIINKSTIESLSNNQEFADNMEKFSFFELGDPTTETVQNQKKIRELYNNIFAKNLGFDPSKFPESNLIGVIRKLNTPNRLENFKNQLNVPDSAEFKWLKDSKRYDSWRYPENINNIINYFNLELSKLGITYKEGFI